MKSLIPVILGLMISSCTQVPVAKFDSPYYKVPLGSILVLKKSLTIPANHARVLIQNGRVLSRRDIDQYYPFCDFEILTLSESDQVIHPDQFKILKLDKRMDTSSHPVMYASLADSQFDRPLIAYNTVMYLSSDKQPDVYRLSCMYWTDDSMATHLTQNQINTTLGDIFHFVIND